MRSRARRWSGTAATLLAKALAIGRRIGAVRPCLNALDVAAGLAVLRGEWMRAARMFGVVEARMQHFAMHRTPADEAILMARIDRARAALGAGFDAATAEGRSLDYDEALDDLTAWLEAHAAQCTQVPG